MFGKKTRELEKRIDSIDKKLEELYENSTVRVVGKKRVLFNAMCGTSSCYKKVDKPVSEIICHIMDYLGLSLEYKEGMPKRPEIKDNAVLVKDVCGIKEEV
jgi:hypothetical protein